MIVAIVVGTIWLVWVVWRSPHRSDLATFGAFAAAVVTIAASLIAWAKNVDARRHCDTRQQRTLDDIADLLGGAVKDQWTRAALERRLHPRRQQTHDSSRRCPGYPRLGDESCKRDSYGISTPYTEGSGLGE